MHYTVPVTKRKKAMRVVMVIACSQPCHGHGYGDGDGCTGGVGEFTDVKGAMVPFGSTHTWAASHVAWLV